MFREEGKTLIDNSSLELKRQSWVMSKLKKKNTTVLEVAGFDPRRFCPVPLTENQSKSQIAGLIRF